MFSGTAACSSPSLSAASGTMMHTSVIAKLSLCSLSSFQAVNIFTSPFLLSLLHFHTICSSILSRSFPLLLLLFSLPFFLLSFCSLTVLNSVSLLHFVNHSPSLTASCSVVCPSLWFLHSDTPPSLAQPLSCLLSSFWLTVLWGGADTFSLLTWLSVQPFLLLPAFCSVLQKWNKEDFLIGLLLVSPFFSFYPSNNCNNSSSILIGDVSPISLFLEDGFRACSFHVSQALLQMCCTKFSSLLLTSSVFPKLAITCSAPLLWLCVPRNRAHCFFQVSTFPSFQSFCLPFFQGSTTTLPWWHITLELPVLSPVALPCPRSHDCTFPTADSFSVGLQHLCTFVPILQFVPFSAVSFFPSPCLWHKFLLLSSYKIHYAPVTFLSLLQIFDWHI